MRVLHDIASMRPGQLTPENESRKNERSRRLSRFNEAGAINPGKQGARQLQRAVGRLASMRPGQLTPENGINGVVLRKISVGLQ